jgi:hypothetical protein
MWITKVTLHSLSRNFCFRNIGIARVLNIDPQNTNFEVAICSPMEYLGIGHMAFNPDRKT